MLMGYPEINSGLRAVLRITGEIYKVKPGYNATKRNRNIGTAKQGHGQENYMTIPESWHVTRTYKETIGNCKKVKRKFASRTLTFLIEENTRNCKHFSSVSDVCEIFKYIPWADWDGLETIIFRQPTKKQEIMSPVWGRLMYFAEIAQVNKPDLARGPTIILEAKQPNDKYTWSTSLGPHDSEELERLKNDGHIIERVGKKYIINTNPDAIRHTQLFRTLIHEIGHWVDYLQKVERPVSKGLDSFEKLNDLYFARSKDEREAFAHRYADELSEKLCKLGVIPFDRIED